jgi:WD40 repeat protein
MNWPTSQDYNEAVQDPATSFSDPDLKGGQVVVNALGLPVPRSGNFADVYQFTGADGKSWALKCFTRKVAGLRERYARIDEHLAKAKLPFTVGFRFLEKGVQVRGEWFPLLKMEWVEGFTLNDFVARNLTKPDLLHRLTQMWAKLAGRLRDANMAHADLQHGNVLLVPGATPQKLGLKLIDYDGMWVPALAEHHSGEVGHPNFQHPLRLKERVFSGEVDRFPHLVIAAGLRAALVGGKPIWEKFDNEDNLLFKEADFRDPASAPVFKALWELNDPVLRTLVGHIALSTKQALRKTPWLDDVLFQEGGPKLTPDEERRVCELLGVTTAAPAAVRAATPAAVEQEFNVFEFLDDDEGPKASPAGSSGRRPVAKRRPPKKSKAPLLIGGGVAAAVLLLGGIAAAVALSNNRKDRPTEVAQAKEKEGEGLKSGGGQLPPKPVAGDVANKDDLRQALADTKWDWGDGILELRADGSVYHPAWNEQFHLAKRWEPIDRRTVLMVVEAGRELNRYGVLEFSEDLSQFTGLDFGHYQRMPDKKRVGPLGRPNFKPAVGTPTQDARQDLQKALAGSAWEWTGGALTLRENGSVAFPRAAGPLAGHWEPIDRRTALLVIDRGKPHDRLAVLQFSEDMHELTGHDFEHAARLPARKRLDGGAAPTGSPLGNPTAIAALPDGRDYLFVRKDDPALYRTVNGASRKAAEVGRAASPIRTVAVTPNGSKAVTGGEDGEVRIWTLAPTGPRAALGRRLGGYDKIDLFQGRFGIDSFDRGVVFHDNTTGKDEVVPVEKPGQPVAARFAATLKKEEKLAKNLGSAMSDEVKLFDGAIVLQVFEGGVVCYNPAVNKSWWEWHGRRNPDAAPAAGGAAEPLRVLKVHGGPVNACAVSPDGSRAVTVGQDQLLCEWDLAGGKLARKFQIPAATGIAYLPDGKTVLVATEAEPGGVWDLAAAVRTKELAGQPAPVTAVCVSPKGDLAWTAGADSQVRAWALPDFKPVGTLPNFRKAALAMAVAPGGEVLAIAVPDGTIHFFAPKTGASYGTHAAKGPIHNLAFLPGGLKLVAAREPDPVIINVQPPPGGGGSPPPGGSAVLTMLQEIDGGETAPTHMGYRPDGKYLWIARQKSMTVADGATGKEVKTWPIEGNTVWHAAFGPGNELFVVVDNRFQAWDWQKGELLHEYNPAVLRGPQAAECWAAPQPNRLLVSTRTPYILLWDTVSWKEAERLVPYPNENVVMVAPYPDATRFAAAVAGRDGLRLVVWDVVERKEAFRLEGDFKTLGVLEVSPGGKWIVGFSGEAGGQASIWDGRTGRLVHTVGGARPFTRQGGFSPGGNHYVFAALGSRRMDLNLEEGRLTDASEGRQFPRSACASPAAGLFASYDADRKIRVWKFEVDTKPADTARTLEPKTPANTAPVESAGFLKDSAELSGTVVAAAVSTDGKRVFVATQNGNVHVLDATTAEEKAKYDVCKGGLIHMVLSPKYISPVNGAAIPEKLYLLNEDRKLHVWDTDKGTRSRDVGLDKAGLPAVTANTRVTIAANESHVLFFDPSWARGYSWSVGRWDETNIPPVLKRPPFNTDTRTVVFASDGSFGAAWASRKLLVWKVRGGKVYPVIDTAMTAKWLAVAGEAGVVIAGDSGRLQAWKIEGGTEVLNVREPHGFVRDYQAAASANGLVTAGADRWLRVWDLKAGKEATRWRVDRTPTGIAVSADGRRAVLWDEDGNKVSLWALPDLKGK